MKKYLVGLFLLLSTVAGASQIILDWDPSLDSDLAGYRMYRGNVHGGPYTPLRSVGLVTTLTDDIAADGNYCYVVTAFNSAALESVYSNEVCILVDTQAPLPPVIRIPVPGQQ